MVTIELSPKITQNYILSHLSWPKLTYGYMTVTDTQNNRILICHGRKSGKLNVERELRHIHPDKVICCYPKRCRREHPGLAFVGDWDNQTHATFWYNPARPDTDLLLIVDEYNEDCPTVQPPENYILLR